MPEKMAMLRGHLLAQTPMSDLCGRILREHDIQPTAFYRWQNQLFENGAAAFERSKNLTAPRTRRIAKLEEILTNKHEVIAERIEEQSKAKKVFGDARVVAVSPRRSSTHRRARAPKRSQRGILVAMSAANSESISVTSKLAHMPVVSPTLKMAKPKT